MRNGKRTILYIHDYAGDARLVRALSGQDDRLDIVKSPARSLDFDRLRSGEFDACLLDLEHRDEQGSAVLAAIREQAGNVPAVLLANGRHTARDIEALHLHIRDGLVRDRGDAGLILRAIFCAIEQRRTERALRESEARYRQLLETVSDYVYMVRIDNGSPAASWHSPTCIAVTGYASGEYAADPFLWFRMIHEDDRQAVVEMTGRVLAGEAPPPLEHRIIHKDGSIRWIRNTPIPSYDPEGRLIACEGIVADISVRKQAEQELLKVNTTTTANIFSPCTSLRTSRR
jgi:PAS domain S-box-containing protein